MPIYSFTTAFLFAFEPIWGNGLLDSIPQTTLESTLIACTIFAILLAIGIYLILYIRKSVKSDGKITNDELLLRFSKLYDEGKITKEEYRQIKLQFAQKLKEEQILASQQQTMDDSRVKKSRKKKKKRGTDSQDTNDALLRSLLDGSNHIGLRSDTGRNSSAHTRSDSAAISRPGELPPRQDAPPEE
ncbi:MAG: hypothetical protein Q4G59_05870 [Planctomycetia bacterium]|nr:hypothetical protein [Planctomycetia bacterium]